MMQQQYDHPAMLLGTICSLLSFLSHQLCSATCRACQLLLLVKALIIVATLVIITQAHLAPRAL